MYRKIYKALEEQGKVTTAVVLDGSRAGSRCMVQNGRCIGGEEAFWKPYEKEIVSAGKTQRFSGNGEEILVEIFQRNPRLILLGGGHVSCAVAKIAHMLGFHITVMDDRREFVTRERFPEADQRICADFTELDARIPVYENAYYVAATRGHAGDTICARQILTRPYTYFGMIGSRTKTALTREKLLGEGFPKERLDTVHAPIGLPIGGQTPEEIAVSIVAEIVQEKNRGYCAYVEEAIAEAILDGISGVMLTIVKKQGSSPRGLGTKLFLGDDGKIRGTIGGGSIEFYAVQDARKAADGELRIYRLSAGDSGRLGMICGGEVEILFERISSGC